jgi:aryl-alcohol dehydrogenase-like predicted oxidoreductase
MQYRTLGQTGMKVSSLCLGTAYLNSWGNADHDDCVRIIHRALDAGINFIDTADEYSLGESEEIVAKALAGGRRDDVILATKFWMRMGDDPNQAGASRRWIIKAVESSLRRLDTDWLDLYQIHRPSPDTDIDETLGALSDLMHQGKIRAIGSSTFTAAQIVEGQWTAQRRNRERVVCEHPPYSILARGIENEVLPVCQKYGLGVMTWAPLASGWLSGRYRKGQDLPRSARAERTPGRFDMGIPNNQRKLEAAEQLAVLAETAELSLVHMALAFILAHPAVTAPVLGARTMEHLDAQLGAAEVRLSDEILDRIDEIVPPGGEIVAGDHFYESPYLDPALRRR